MPIPFSRYRKCLHVTAQEVDCRPWLPAGTHPVAPPSLSSIDSIMEALSHDQRYINIDTRLCRLEFNTGMTSVKTFNVSFTVFPDVWLRLRLQINIIANHVLSLHICVCEFPVSLE